MEFDGLDLSEVQHIQVHEQIGLESSGIKKAEVHELKKDSLAVKILSSRRAERLSNILWRRMHARPAEELI